MSNSSVFIDCNELTPTPVLYAKEGSVVEKGTHKELLALQADYDNMYNIQFQAFEGVSLFNLSVDHRANSDCIGV